MAPLAAQASAPASRLGKRARARRALAIIVGAALGGAIVGCRGRMARWSLAALVGLTVEAGGGIEGLVIGAAAGAGYALATSHSRLRAAALMAACCGLGAFALTISGRPARRRHTARDCQAGARLAFPSRRWRGCSASQTSAP